MKTFKLLFTTVGIGFTTTSCQVFSDSATQFASFQKEMETDIKAHSKVIVYKREEVSSNFNWDTHQRETNASHYFVGSDGSVMSVEAGDFYRYNVGDSYYNSEW